MKIQLYGAVSFNAETTDKVIIMLGIMTVLCMDYQIPQRLNWNYNRMFALDWFSWSKIWCRKLLFLIYTFSSSDRMGCHSPFAQMADSISILLYLCRLSQLTLSVCPRNNKTLIQRWDKLGLLTWVQKNISQVCNLCLLPMA